MDDERYENRKLYVDLYRRKYNLVGSIDDDINKRRDCSACFYSDHENLCKKDRTITKANCIRGKKEYAFGMSPVVHRIKIKKKYYDAICNGEKTYEIRFNDRAYEVGDYLNFIIIDDNNSDEVLDDCSALLFHVLSVDYYPEYMKIGYVIMSIDLSLYSYDIEKDMLI